MTSALKFLFWSETRLREGVLLQVGVYEAKTRLSQLIDRAAKGEEIIITKHGVPVAALVPVAGLRQKGPQAAIAAIKDFRRGRRLTGLSIREMIGVGRQ